MKYTNKFLGALCLTAFGFASCADDYSLLDYEVGQMPADLAAVEYLKEYDDVKTYVDREANPNFKLGAGVTVSSYNEGGIEYRMAVHNFDEVTAGNAMKYSSVVANDGSMEFGPVENFVEKAQAAGQTIYGHTLAWHSQQNNKYLNGIIADIIDPDYVPELVPVTKVDKRTVLIAEAAEKVANPWDSQFFITFPGASFAEGDTWSFKMNVRADKAASVGTQTHTSPGAYIHWAGIGTVNFTTEWAEYSQSGTMTAEQNGGFTFAFNLNDFAEANKYYFDDFSFMLNGEELVINGDLNDLDDTTCYVSVYDRGAQVPSTIVDSYEYTVLEEVPTIQEVQRTCIMVESDDKVDQAWDTQFWIIFPGSEFKTGDSWSISMEVRAEKDASSSTQVHKDAGAYLHWAAIGTVPFTTDWAQYTASGTIEAAMNGGYSIAFNLNDFPEANRYYFDNVSFKLNGEELVKNGNLDGDDMTNFVAKEKRGGTVPARKIESYTIELPGGRTPLTPEEKKDTLMWAMDNWIKGMMTATKGYVSTWDAVNEPISGTGGEFYDLWSADNGDASKNFYWQDYLGDEEYVRFVIAKAREYYTGEEPLKLFVNDYNLESDWDQNKKLKSLIHWIEVWESDNTTKIDGIGTQMHISYYENPETLASKNAAIENMFKLMAATGKLVKISELDLAYVGADGKVIKYKDLTEEQIKTLSDYYKYIVETYMELIPANQQYGITLWCPIDSPASSSWRGGEAVGLWDGNYNRRHTYAGFADGLAGKE